MAKTKYTPGEAWAVFIGGLIIGVVFTSFFWAYITTPEEVRNINRETIEEIGPIELVKPVDFINFCKNVRGDPQWDSTGYRKCAIEGTDERDVVVMSVLCRKFDLNISYGSFGVQCEGKI